MHTQSITLAIHALKYLHKQAQTCALHPSHISDISVLNNRGPALFLFPATLCGTTHTAQIQIDWMINEPLSNLRARPLLQQEPINALFVFASAFTAVTALL